MREVNDHVQVMFNTLDFLVGFDQQEFLELHEEVVNACEQAKEGVYLVYPDEQWLNLGLVVLKVPLLQSVVCESADTAE
jgi:hypothetical protein